MTVAAIPQRATRKKRRLALVHSDFLVWITTLAPKEEQVAPTTAERYLRYVLDCESRHGPLTHLNVKALEQWRQAIAVAGKAGNPATPSTVKVKISAVRAYCAFLVATRRRADNPAKALSLPKTGKRIPKPYAYADVERLFAALYVAEPTSEVLQDRAIFEVLYGSGLRREEAGSLTLGNLIGTDWLHVVAGKGNKDRKTMVTSAEYAAVRAWMLHSLGDERTHRLVAEIDEEAAFLDLRKRFPDAPIFRTRTGLATRDAKDPGKYLAQRVHYWCEKVGIAQGTAHRFRHSFFTHLIDAGADLFALKQMGGHSSFAVTEGYIEASERGLGHARRLHPREVK